MTTARMQPLSHHIPCLCTKSKNCNWQRSILVENVCVFFNKNRRCTEGENHKNYFDKGFKTDHSVSRWTDCQKNHSNPMKVAHLNSGVAVFGASQKMPVVSSEVPPYDHSRKKGNLKKSCWGVEYLFRRPQSHCGIVQAPGCPIHLNAKRIRQSSSSSVVRVFRDELEAKCERQGEKQQRPKNARWNLTSYTRRGDVVNVHANFCCSQDWVTNGLKGGNQRYVFWLSIRMFL